MLTIYGRHINTMEPVELNIENGSVVSVKQIDTSELLPIIAPGLIDLQVNGYMGIDFNDASLADDGILKIIDNLFAAGVTAFYPTIITNEPALINDQLVKIREAVEHSLLTRSVIAGVHLEGPFISLVDGPLGAHNRQYVQAPDIELMKQFIDSSGGLIKIITLSPEWPGSDAFIQWCRSQGITVSIGHTAANTDQINIAVEAGATMSTHLGNAAHQLLPRHPNYIWDQLANDGLSASFIGDGFHLPDSVIKTILRMKDELAILVSDSVSLAGMPAGAYTTPVGGSVVLSEDGRLSLAENPAALAGSAQNIFQAIKTLIKKGLCDLPEAWKLASINPAKEMKLPYSNPWLAGANADFVLLDDSEEISIQAVYKNGELVHTKNSAL